MPVSFQKLHDAYVGLDMSAEGENEALCARRPAGFYFQSDFDLTGKPEDALPDDIEDATKYATIPNKRALDLGTKLVMAFAREVLPQDYPEIGAMWGHAAFKKLLIRRRALERWHEYADQATERALRDWCAANAIEIVD